MSHTPKQLLEHIQRELPSLAPDDVKRQVVIVGGLSGLSEQDTIFSEEQWAHATLLVEMVKSGEASDFSAAHAALSSDSAHGSLPELPNPADQLMQATRSQVKPAVAPVAQGVVQDVLEDFAGAYRPMVEQAVVEAVAELPPVEVNIAEIVQGKSKSGGGTFTKGAQKFFRAPQNKALPEADPSQS